MVPERRADTLAVGAEPFSTDRMAMKVVAQWRAALDR
jgi:hypothetical protein